jgi:anti-sigma B factor antagonist
MNINVQKTNQTATLVLEGRLDTTTAPELEKALSELGADVKDLIMDLKDLAYVSSAGLRVLLSAQKKFGKTGTMKLQNVCDTVMEVFEITGFADILVIE